MVYNEDGTPTAPVAPVPPIQLPAPAPAVEPPRLLAEACSVAARTAPDTTQDEQLAKMLQAEADEEAHQLLAQQRQHTAADNNNAEHDLFGSEDGEAWDAIDTNELNDMLEEDADGYMHIKPSATTLAKRRRMQRNLFGDDEDEPYDPMDCGVRDGQTLWHFNGAEWLQTTQAEVIRSLGAHGMVKQEEPPDHPAISIDFSPVPVAIDQPFPTPLSSVALYAAQAGEQATGEVVEREEFHSLEDMADALVPDLD